MKKVIVIGCPGSGKSTFSRELNKRTGLPLFYLMAADYLNNLKGRMKCLR